MHGSIRGQGATGPVPLAFAFIEVGTGGAAGAGAARFTVLSDDAGRYAVHAVPAGPVRLRVVHVGYRPLEVEVVVPAGGSVALDLELEALPIALAPITVWGHPPGPVADSGRLPARELAEMAFRALDATPGLAEAGLGTAARSAAGGEPLDPTDALLMRGSTTDLKLVLLDGAPIYAPFHVAGLLPGFDPAALEQARLYVGGAPARYDGGLSYILDLRTRGPRGDRVHGEGALDLLAARTLVELPLQPSAGGATGASGAGAPAGAGGGSGVLLAARALHPYAGSLLWGGRPPYGYADGLARVTVEAAPGHRISATAFWNRESVVLTLPAPVPDGESGAGAAPAVLWSRDSEDDAVWGNAALAVGYGGRFGATDADLSIAASRYTARLPLPGSNPRIARGTSERLRATADLARPLGNGWLRFGGSYDAVAASSGAQTLAAGARAVRARADAAAAGAYLEAEGPLGREFRARGGLRVDHFSTEGRLRAAPRLALTWLLTDDALLTLALGRYHQYGAAPDTLLEVALADTAAGAAPAPPTPTTRPAGPRLPVAAASHVVLSLEQFLAPGLRLGLDGFVKRFTGAGPAGSAQLNASGIDLRVLREGARTTAWLGYSLTWFWEKGGAPQRSANFAGRQLLTAGLSGRVSRRGGADLRIAYGDGLPYTTIPLETQTTAPDLRALQRRKSLAGRQLAEATAPLAGGPTEDFLRLDAEIFLQWHPRWHGRATELRPYLRVLNALDRRDALFYYFEPWRDPGVRPIAELPLLPVLGLEWRF